MTSGQSGRPVTYPVHPLTSVFNRIILLNVWIVFLCVTFVFLHSNSPFITTLQCVPLEKLGGLSKPEGLLF